MWVVTPQRGNTLGVQAVGRDEIVGHAHRHGDDVGQREERLGVRGPHAGGMLMNWRGHGVGISAARVGLCGLVARGTGCWGRERVESWAAGHPCEGRMNPH